MFLTSLARRLGLAVLCIAVFLGVAASFRVNPPAGASLLGALLVLAFGLFVLLRGAGLPLNRAFFYLSLCLGGYILLVYLLQIATVVGIEGVKGAVWFLRHALLLAPAVMMHFVARFVEGHRRVLRVLTGAALLCMAPFIVLNLLGRYVTEYQLAENGWTYVPANALRLYRLSGLCTIFWALVSGIVIVAQCFRPSQRHRRARFTLFLVGWSVAIGHALVGYLTAFGRSWFPPLTGATWAFFPMVLGIAVLRFSLFDIKVVIRRTLPYAVGTALVGSLYAACLAALESLSARLELLPRGAQWVVLLILMGLAFQPLLEGLQAGLDRLFFRVEAEMDRFLARAAERYRLANSRRILAQMLAADAAETLKLEGVSVLLGPGTVAEAVPHPGGAPPSAVEGLAMPAPGSPRAAVEAGGDGSLALPGAGALAARLTASGARLAVPFGEGRTRGLLACGGKRSHLAFTPRDRMFLVALTAQAEAALSRLEARQDADAAHRLTEAVFESMTNAVALVDAGGRLLNCNPAFGRAFGAGRGAALADLGLAGALEEGALAGPVELQAAGGIYLVSAKPLDAPTEATLVVLTDVTELRRLQEADRRRAALAEIGATVSAINHEIGNIVSPVSFFLNKIRRARGPDEAREALEAAAQRIRALEGLSRELRGFYREPQLSPCPVVLARAIESALADVSAAAGPAWSAPAREGLELTLHADPQKLKQILVNLLKNAWEAMAPRGTRKWSVRAQREGDRARIELRDSGGGVPPERLPRLFEPFFTTKRERGTGLGLAIVRRLVQAHDAEIVAESELGTGMTITLLWPLATEGASVSGS